MAKERKLIKAVEGTVVRIKEVTTGTEMAFDFALLPEDIKAKLGPFGLSHKLGDAAAGEVGQGAVDSINKVWDGLLDGNWAVRGTRGESVSMSAVQSGIEKLPEKEQIQARRLMLKLKILKPATVDDFNYLAGIKAISQEDADKGIAALEVAKAE